jgi:sialate O-acetylesterase
MQKLRILFLGGLLALPSAAFGAEFKLASVFGNHMVLQREKPVAIWGWADPAEPVQVQFGTQRKKTTADSEGRWTLLLDSMPASAEPRTLTATGSGERTATVADVLVGEVWLGSGQSNMAFSVREARDFPTEQSKAQFPLIRVYKETSRTATTAQPNGSGAWSVCSPETVGQFSAVLYFFGREIHSHLEGIPVGLLNSSVGGTRIEWWIPAEAQTVDEETKASYDKALQEFQEFDPSQAPVLFEKQKAIWHAAAEKAKANHEFPPYPPKDPLMLYQLKGGPAGLFNGKIANLVPFTLRGILWYQGEGNASNGALYRKQLTALVTSWRALWKEELPFAWVQLPNYHNKGEGWPLVRESMRECLSLPNTGMAIAIDLGEKHEIHPPNKQDVGKRLSLWALSQVYHQPITPYSGPLIQSAEVVSGAVRLRFQHTGTHLQTANQSPLTGFELSSADGVWKNAEARIENDLVVLSSPEIPQPVAARYAWAAWPNANLCNSANLPAAPFRISLTPR